MHFDHYVLNVPYLVFYFRSLLDSECQGAFSWLSVPNFPISVLFPASLMMHALSRFQKRCGGRILNKNINPLTYPEAA